MLICDRCLKNHSNIQVYCFGKAMSDYPGLAHHDLCPDCAKEFAEQFERFVSHNEDISPYATAEWQRQLKEYEEDCRRRGEQ